MIDIVTNGTKALKDIRQIGTPTEPDKIYIEHLAYERLHQENCSDKRVFVFMGHTQHKERGYLTFIQSVIPVYDIEFEQNVPVWNNRIWSGIFREIKNFYEDDVIVGWAIDLKGMEPKMSPEIEAVHREQFGGVHQILMMLDSLEQEEYFYQNRNNHLRKKDGFYIYYDATAKQPYSNVELQLDMPLEQTTFRRKKAEDLPAENWQGEPERQKEKRPQAQYRAFIEEKKKATDPAKKLGIYGVVAILALIIGIIGTGIYQNRIPLGGLQKIAETFGEKQTSDEPLPIDTQEAETEKTQPQQETQPQETTQSQNQEQLQENEGTQEEQIQAELNLMQQEGDKQSENSNETEVYVQVEETSGGAIMQSPIANAQPESNLEEMPNAAVTETMEELAEQKQEEIPLEPRYYIVEKGDTLTSICYQTYGTITRVAELERVNGLSDPDDIRVGQQLLLPE